MARNTADNALLNKRDIKDAAAEGRLIKGLPVVDSNNPELIEAAAGNELRVLKDYAPAFDFIANLIHKAIHTGNPARHIKDVDANYYKMLITEPVWQEYFARCGDFTLRQSLARQVMKNLQSGWVLLKGENKRGRYIEKRAPFRIMAEEYQEDGTKYREVFLAKAVFGTLITQDCFKNGGDGYIELPANFYPLITGTDKGALESFNPVYKLHLHGLMKNTHKKDCIEVPRQELIRIVASEYLDAKGYLKKITAAALQDSLETSLRQAEDRIRHDMIVKAADIGNSENAILYFTEKP